MPNPTSAGQPNPYLAIDRQILADAVESTEVGKNLFMLCDRIGPRFAGTDGYGCAAEYVRDKFQEYQLTNPHLEPFEFTAWRRGAPAQLVMTTPVSREFSCYALPYGAVTGPSGIRAEMVDVGGGTAAELEALRSLIPGRFVLTNGSGGHRKEIYERCVARGAAGFLISNRVPGMMLHSGSVGDGVPGAIPAVSIALESGLQIQRLAQGEAVHFHLVTNGRYETATTWNVVGEISGREHPEELVIMGGHLDSHEIGPGAYDNAAGAVSVMEAARLLARYGGSLKRTIRFIVFGAEEVGLLGSHHHARAHAAELRRARWMLNCDVPPLGGPRGLIFHNCPEAESYVTKLSEEMGCEIPYLHQDRRHSDHYPFQLQGVTTAGIIGGRSVPGGQRFMHMAGDTVEKIPVAALCDTAAFAARVLLRAANDEHWPGRSAAGKARVRGG